VFSWCLERSIPSARVQLAPIPSLFVFFPESPGIHDRRTVSLKRRLALLRDDFTSVCEAIRLSAPVELSTEEARKPNRETLQIAKRVEPAEAQRSRIAQKPPTHNNRLNHTVQERGPKE